MTPMPQPYWLIHFLQNYEKMLRVPTWQAAKMLSFVNTFPSEMELFCLKLHVLVLFIITYALTRIYHFADSAVSLFPCTITYSCADIRLKSHPTQMANGII
jgi:hypothetical protein